MESVKIMCIGDPHFKEKNIKETNQMHFAVEKLLKNDKIAPDLIVVLGDVLHRHETIKETPLRLATNFLKMLEKYAPLYLVVGNHDRPNNSVFLTDQHPFNAMKYWENTSIVDIPVCCEVKGHLFTFVPYVYPGRFQEALDHENLGEGAWKKSTCIFAHQEFKNCKKGSIISEEGDEWSLDLPLVVSGHIHDYDHLQSNIIYCGTPIQHAFGDRTDKTISLFTFKADKSFQEDRVSLGIPKKVEIKVNYEDIDKTEIPENAEVKIIIIGNTAQNKTAEKLTKIKKWIKMGVKISYKDISTINLNISNQEITRRYEELLIESLKTLSPEESKTLISLFKSICKEIMDV